MKSFWPPGIRDSRHSGRSDTRVSSFHPPTTNVSGADVYLVGDAVAQVKVTTVGGLVTGLRGARAAANAILRGRDYLKELRPLRYELGLHLMLRCVLNRFCSRDYYRLLGLLNEKTLHLLGRYNRD